MSKYAKLILLLPVMFLASCSDEKVNEQQKQHVWQHQTDTLKQSKEVSQQLQKSLDQRKQQLDQSN